ncbi:MAG: methyltransferase domain-containing protein [Rhodobacter sp.]|nr:methyltransferase domain-containing protein [Paracoccaceae bacterium]MCC0077692.1 methyltransferase domain-containing protein [Rhodobacter sp.]
MTQPADDPRLLAARLVAGVLTEGRMLADAPQAGGDPAVRARALRLAQLTLRHFSRTEAILSPLLRKPPPPLPMALLRVATVEMLEAGAPPHGVVNAVVSLLRAGPKTAPFAGMANAVLRKVAAHPGWAEMPAQRLPGWLRRRLRGIWGEDVVQAIEAAQHQTPPVDLTLKPGAAPVPDAQALPGGSLRLTGPVQVSALPGFEAGDWWVQDAAAALPAGMLALHPGETALDLCAAPGGKTMQMAATGATVTAVDLSAPRLERVRANLARTGLSATVVCADALDWAPPVPVDAVLLDAPCSATGTIRRHPDLPFLRKPADVAALVDLQGLLLDRALGFLKPGGRLVYCTCSLLPEEGEDQIAAALTRHPGLLAQTPPQPFGRATAEGGWRTRPDDLPGGVDGFYMALLRRDAA